MPNAVVQEGVLAQTAEGADAALGSVLDPTNYLRPNMLDGANTGIAREMNTPKVDGNVMAYFADSKALLPDGPTNPAVHADEKFDAMVAQNV